ncbi:MAG: ComEC family competence protein [Cytophagaceae bacterium]|nr:ComEC family competence protein [Cytophagaceae bacterium]
MPGIFFSYQSECKMPVIFNLIIILSFSGLILFIFAPSFYRKRRLRIISGIIIAIFLFSAAWMLTQQAMPSKIKSEYDIIAEGRVERIENPLSQWVRIIFIPEKISNSEVPVKRNDRWLLMMRNDSATQLPAIDRKFLIRGRLNGLPRVVNPDAFDYGAYLFRRGITGQMFVNPNDFMMIDEPVRIKIKAYAEMFRNFCIALFANNGVEDTQRSILSALILGERSDIDHELNDSFVRSGAVHMLAVSGLHVGIIYLIINWVLSFFLKPTHPCKFLIMVALLFAYAFVTGFSPSVMRAVVMFSFVQGGKVLAKEANIYNNLCASAFFLLLYNPLFLFNTGFWLSHLAVAGIVAFTPMLENIMRLNYLSNKKVHHYFLKKTGSLISVSLAAQMGVFPALLYIFGAFPVYFLLANLLVLPLIAPVIIIGILFLLTAWIPLVPQILSWALNLLIKLIELLVTWVDALPYSYMENMWVSLPMMIILFVLVMNIYSFDEYVSARKLIKTGITLALLLFVCNIQYFTKKTNSQLVVFSTGNQALIEVITGGESNLFLTSDLNQKGREYAAGAFERKNVIQNNAIYILNDTSKITPSVYRISTCTEKILIIGESKKRLSVENIDSCSFVILAGNVNINFCELINKTKCHTVVLASNCPVWKTKEWMSESENSNATVYDVRKNGAFNIKFGFR